MHDSTVAAAIYGALIGAGVTLVVTLVTLAFTSRQDVRAVRLETAERIAKLEGSIWNDGGPSLLRELKHVDLRLRVEKVPERLRNLFRGVTYKCWTVGQAAVPAQGEVQISEEWMENRRMVEQVLVADVLRDQNWWSRRKNRQQLFERTRNLELPILPGFRT